MTLRSQVFSSVRKSLRASCWVSVLAPPALRISMRLVATARTSPLTLSPKCSKKPESSAASTAWRICTGMSS